MSKTLWIVVAVVVIILGGAWLFMMKGNSSVQAPAATAGATEQPSAMTAQSPSPSAMESASSSPAALSKAAVTAPLSVTITGSEFSFSPSTISAKVGQAVTVTFTNGGQYPHNFTITELNVSSKTVQPGESDTVTFTPSKAGSYTYFCSIDSHEARGMKGTLTVQ